MLLKIFVQFHKFLNSFVVGVISCKCQAYGLWIEIYPEMGPIDLVPGPNSIKFRRADQMDFSALANLTYLEGQTF